MQKSTSVWDQAPGAMTNQLNATAVLAALWRAKSVIIIFAAIGILVGGYYAFFIAVPRYSAVTTLALQLRNEQIVNLEQVLSGVSTDTAAINTELEVIQSRGVLEKLVEELDLTSNPEFNAQFREENLFSFNSLRNTISRSLTDLADNGHTVEQDRVEKLTPEQEAVNAAVNSVGNAISVVNRHNTYVFEIRTNTSNSFLSAEIANSLAEIYIQDQIDVKFQATENAVTWLSDRVAVLKGDLEEKEETFKRQRAKLDLRNPDILNTLSSQKRENEVRLKAVTEEIGRLEAQAAQIKDIGQDPSLKRIATALQDTVLSQLLPQSGSREGRSRFMARIELLSQQVATSLVRAKAQAIALENSIERFQSEVDVQSEQLIALQQMERDLESTRTLYETFLTRQKETTVQRGLQQADSRILSKAVPGRYVAPRKMFILVLSALLGGLAGAALVMQRTFIISGFRSSADLQSVTGLTVFGEIPNMPIRRRGQLIDYLHDSPTAPAIEAVRNFRTSLMLLDAKSPPQVILLSSSVPGEGKTTQAISLAYNMASLGRRTILVEADLRRKSLRKYFSPTAESATSTSALDEAVPLQDVVAHDHRVGFDILLGEELKMNPADLFASEQFKNLLQRLRKEYDYIIIDSPPVLVVPDARLIAPLVDSIVFVVAWQRTSQLQVLEGLRQFSSIDLPVSGLVLSQVDVRKMQKYGYGRYSNYSSASYGS